VAIIGGVLTSTALTLLVIPSFYDSTEIASERAKLKFRARAALGNPFVAFLVTFVEGLLTLTLLRFLYRAARWLLNRAPAEHPVERAARLKRFAVPEGFEPYPAPWQRQRGTLTLATSG
jgi:HAE1 family hydrophobic/amphiphilic exporter-1